LEAFLGGRFGTRGGGERRRYRFIRGAELVLRRRGLSEIGQVRDQGAVVPGLWHLEVANVLLQAEKRGRITTADVTMRLDLIAKLPIMTDNETTARAWREILALARVQELTTYDAAYLELAIRRGMPLVTKDEALIGAAERTGVPVPG
jgi:predicted nucleic acid-binding protein